MKVINQNTATTSATEPAASAITYGEIAINYHTDNPRILIKDSANKIVGFPTEKQINKSLSSVNQSIIDINKDIDGNTTDIENLESWIATPLTTAEIESAFV